VKNCFGKVVQWVDRKSNFPFIVFDPTKVSENRQLFIKFHRNPADGCKGPPITGEGSMDIILKVLVDYKIVDACIILVGVFGFALVIDRFKALYMDLAMPTEQFMKQVMGMVEQDKIEEAITFCAANDKKPLAYVVKRVLETSDREDSAIESSLDIAASEVAPKLVKNLGHLSMIANVVTLIGLLGTVCGLIVAFKAVSFADVAQKQTLLAEGISIAMTATALGLIVAIPVMFFYSFLHAKQTRLFAEIDLHSNKVVDMLKSRGYKPFAHATAYPNMKPSDLLTKKAPTKAA
jgi:biopolymer transport protein ExbB/TolQ